MDETNKPAKTTEQPRGADSQLDLDHFTLIFANMNKAEKEKALSDPGVFKQIVESEINYRAVLSAAIANKVEQDRNVAFLIRRAAESILREAYLKILVGKQIPDDFPTEKQIAEFYESNKERYVIPERVHVWQIYFDLPKDADKSQIAQIKKKANNIYTKLKQGKADFSSVAVTDAEHIQNKTSAGYMGLFKVDELLPEIKKPLLELEEDQIGKIESEKDIRILKRSRILVSESLELHQVQKEVSQMLVEQGHKQIRNTFLAQITKEFPQNVISDEKMEKWRLQLQGN